MHLREREGGTPWLTPTTVLAIPRERRGNCAKGPPCQRFRHRPPSPSLLPSLRRSKVGGQARAGPGWAGLAYAHLLAPGSPPPSLPPRLATCLPPPLACKTWLLARYPSIQSKSHVSLLLRAALANTRFGCSASYSPWQQNFHKARRDTTPWKLEIMTQ